MTDITEGPVHTVVGEDWDSVVEAARGWTDRFEQAARDIGLADAGIGALTRNWAEAFPAGYRDRYDAREALVDLGEVDRLGSADVVVAISQSGRTQALLESLALARRGGAQIIALAPGDTPVARAADIAIAIDIEEETERYTPLPSRIAHMAVFDVLAVGVARLKGPGIGEHLRHLNRELEGLRRDR